MHYVTFIFEYQSTFRIMFLPRIERNELTFIIAIVTIKLYMKLITVNVLTDPTLKMIYYSNFYHKIVYETN